MPILSFATSSLLACILAQPSSPFGASDWVTTGTDCTLFTAGDLDGDGFDDVVTLNGGRDLCVAFSVRGWKAANWEVLAHNVSEKTTAIAVGDFTGSKALEVATIEPDKVVIFTGHKLAGIEFTTHKDVSSPEEGATLGVEPGAPRTVHARHADKVWTLREGKFVAEPSDPTLQPRNPSIVNEDVATPPYDNLAPCIALFSGDFNGDKGPDTAFVFACRLPYPHHQVRIRFGGMFSDDFDGDGLTNDEEKAIGTDPRSRDTDGDGLLDGWEVHGLPRGIQLGDLIGLFDPKATGAEADRRLSPLRQDVIVNVSYFEGVNPEQFRPQMARAQQVYRDLSNLNPDGSHGVWVHMREVPGFVSKEDQKMPWWDVGNKYFPASERGLMHWMQVTPHGGGQSGETADMGGCGNGWAVFAHEFGHQLSLSHTGDSAPGWCPLYTSLMNYAYSYSFDGDGNKPHLSNGEFRAAILDERHLKEKLDFPIDKLKFLANHPFRFTLKDNGDGTTLIDWNQNGVFDTGEVEADINYGGSTHAGERKTIGLVGSAASLACINGKCLMAASDHKQTTVNIRCYRGGDNWTPDAPVANSASRFDPVLVGSAGGDTEDGAVFDRRFEGWNIARVTLSPSSPSGEEAPPTIGPLVALPDLPAADLSAIRIAGRYLIITRHDTDALEYRWLTFGEKPILSEPKPFTLQSMVPVGITQGEDGKLTVVSSIRHPQKGPFCMQVTTLAINGDDIAESPPEWTHGHGHNHCTSRPVPVWHKSGTDAQPQLVIFHTGWTDANGCWTAWRTTRIGNKALDDGWLTSQLYDEWTRSRVAVGFADGPQGTVYTFRWDPGDHRDWKVNTLFVAYNGYGIDDQPMRDFDDAAKISKWGIRQSILTMRRLKEDETPKAEPVKASGPTPKTGN
jgi:hypothetical protein